MSIVLAETTRDHHVENMYRGDVVVMDHNGDIITQLGNGNKTTYWRSAAKPFQVLPMLEAGGMETYGFSEKELALMTSSHGGEAHHAETVAGILRKIGLSPELLQCGAAMPMHQPEAFRIKEAGETWSVLHNCCSGKHSAMLALALLKGYTLEGYTEAAHPVQKDMLQIVSEMTNMDSSEIGVGIDGCGVPIFHMPLTAMARAYAILSLPEETCVPDRAAALRRVAGAMSRYPWYVAGTNRLDTAIMEVTKGEILAKLGADGVYCVSVLEEGIGIALKIESGDVRAIEPVIIELLNRLELLSEEEHNALKKRMDSGLYNHRKNLIGEIRAVF